ncbi:hypothetical protein BAU18_001190 [Enterococcus diestrammenae]|uniref:Uncharacterized protein n=1 Tax=Enterococcus diestrammenae TaxID=1155073 RepID=A0ABV0F0L5_9ENTE
MALFINELASFASQKIGWYHDTFVPLQDGGVFFCRLGRKICGLEKSLRKT